MHSLLTSSALVLLLAFCLDASAGPTAAELIELDFEELVNMDIKVRSAGKTATRAMDLPYAAFVVSQNDIQRSGAQSIPDALRLAPGVTVSQISSGEWAIGIRGGGGRFSRFVLVMVNGKIAYNSVFSGVNWDELNLTLSQIERIEVIRGPNAASWGDNAVNGIINIITFRPQETVQGIQAWGGSAERYGASFTGQTALDGRWQGSLAGHVSHWQGMQGSTSKTREPGHQDWRLSAQLDRQSAGNSTAFNADYFGAKQAPEWSWTDDQTLDKTFASNNEDKTGWSIQAEHRQSFGDQNHWKLRASANSTRRDTFLYQWDSTNTQFDAELLTRWRTHTITTGLNTRTNRSSALTRPEFVWEFTPPERDLTSLGIFLSDTIQVSDALQVTLSARLDDNDLSSSNLQPSLRALWKPLDKGRLWVAVSEASTTPSRALVDIQDVTYAAIPPEQTGAPLPTALLLSGYRTDMDDTKLRAIEAGYRHTFENFNLDLALFDFDYSNEVNIELLGEPTLVFDENYQPSHLVQHSAFVNDRSFSSRGGELSMRGQFTKFWTFQFAYSVTDRRDSSSGPSLSGSLMNTWALSNTLSLNIWLRYSEGNADSYSEFSDNAAELNSANDYYVFDTNLSWQLNKRWQLQFIANNLGEKHTEAMREEFGAELRVVEPYALLKASLRL